MQNSIEVKNVTKTYTDFKLDNISFEIPKGTIVGIVGENGAGKTTLIRLILNIIKKEIGEIKVFGVDNIDNDTSVKENIGVVMDECFFYETLTSFEINKIMKNIYTKWDEDLFFNYIKKFGISEKKQIKELSKGMKMKLYIATAVSHRPKLLILDEPTSGLDPVSRNEILDIFMDFIQDDENSILMTSHITSDLEKISDYMIFIHEGKVVINQTKDNIKESYGIIKCGKDEFEKIDKSDILRTRKNKFSCEVLVDNKKRMKLKYSDLVIDDANMEDIMMFFVRGETV